MEGNGFSRSFMAKVQREQLKVVAERAILVCVQISGSTGAKASAGREGEQLFRELKALAETAGAQIIGTMHQKIRRVRASTYLGKGKVQELAELVKSLEATLVIFDNDLSPGQIRELEQETSCKIIDRSELILDIFANRATTHAAKLQVEIAQLEYTYPRLRAMWDHLEQIVGGAPVGIGTRGPGEKQLEIDRRLVQRRVRRLKDELSEIESRKQRDVYKRNLDHFTVGFVGYTNAGKSTLFNRLTAGGAYADDKLFATLSTRTERWPLGGGNEALLSDTVGFIRDLPHHLIASFKSTLEETVSSMLLIIVLDVSDPEAEQQLETVQRTLDEIGATTQPRLLALNKVDRLQRSTDLLTWLNRYPDAVPISAVTGEGLPELTEQVRTHMMGPIREVDISTPLNDSKTMAFLEQRTTVLSRDYNNGTATLRVRIGQRQVQQLLARGASFTINGQPPTEGLRKTWDIKGRTRTRADAFADPDTEVAPLGTPPHERLWHHD